MGEVIVSAAGNTEDEAGNARRGFMFGNLLEEVNEILFGVDSSSELSV